MLEDNWNDDLRREFSDNFENLAREVGTDTLVVRGSDRSDFSYAIFETYGINMHTVLPALVITDTAPTKIGQLNAGAKENTKLIVIPLENQFKQHGSVTRILKEVAKTLHDKEAIDSLKSLDKLRIKQKWGWLRYFELKPNFAGFGLNINKIIEESVIG